MRHRLAAIGASALCWLSVAGFIAWLAGCALGDAWRWSQWLFWIPGFAVAVLAAVALVAARAAVSRRRWSGPQACLLVTTLLSSLWQNLGFGPSGIDHPMAVRILQWNTAWPSSDDARSADFLAAHPHDLVLISNRGAITSPDLVRAWAGTEARVVGAGPFALITRLPVIEARQVAVGGKGRQLWWVARFEVAPPTWSGRTLRIAMVDLPSRPTIAKSLVAEGLWQACEAGELGEVDLVAGDFNATDGSVILRRCFPAYRDALSVAGRGWLATWPRRFPLWKIDHVLLGDSVDAVAACTLDAVVSQHRATSVAVVPAARR